MRCGKCGASSRVLYTTELDGQFMTRRRRECDNLHRFNTYEVHWAMLVHAGPQRLRTIIGRMKARIAMYRRDLAWWTAHHVRKEGGADIARRAGLPKSTVRNAILRIDRDRKRGSQDVT